MLWLRTMGRSCSLSCSKIHLLSVPLLSRLPLLFSPFSFLPLDQEASQPSSPPQVTTVIAQLSDILKPSRLLAVHNGSCCPLPHTLPSPYCGPFTPESISGTFLVCDINKVALETADAWAACCYFTLDISVPRLPGTLSEHVATRSKPALQLSS